MPPRYAMEKNDEIIWARLAGGAIRLITATADMKARPYPAMVTARANAMAMKRPVAAECEMEACGRLFI